MLSNVKTNMLNTTVYAECGCWIFTSEGSQIIHASPDDDGAFPVERMCAIILCANKGWRQYLIDCLENGAKHDDLG